MANLPYSKNIICKLVKTYNNNKIVDCFIYWYVLTNLTFVKGFKAYSIIDSYELPQII